MGSGGSKQKSKVNNISNNSNSDKPSSSKTPPNVNTDQQKQTPPTDEKLPPISKTDTGKGNDGSQQAADPIKLPSVTSKDDIQQKDQMQDTSNKETKDGKSALTETVMKADENEKKEIVKVPPEVDVKMIEEDPEHQRKFDAALKCACLLLKPECIYNLVTKHVTKLHLARALPWHFSLETLLSKFVQLQDLDISHNQIGPQGFRAICLAMCGNSTILSLNLADNKSDTDSADCLGKMVEENKILQYLDVSSNYLGKDYFSRRVGPALKTNKSLKTLRCESIGTTDARLLIEGFQENTSLVELDISHNEISDTLGFAKGLAVSLKRENCTLSTLCLSRCGFNSAGIKELIDGLKKNESLKELNLSGSEFDSLDLLLQLIVSVIQHSSLYNICLDNSIVKSQNITSDLPACENLSVLQILSLHSCGLNDAFFTSLLKICQGKLLSLVEVDLASNEKLSVSCIECLVKMTSTDEGPSSLRKMGYGLNKAEEIPGALLNPKLQNLSYLSLRKCQISAESVGEIARCWDSPTNQLSTLILDGLKISATPALKILLAKPKTCKLTTLSLGGCQLDDSDITPLIEAWEGGLALSMLKLSANRLTDKCVEALTFKQSPKSPKSRPFEVLDLSNNRITNEGAADLSFFFGKTPEYKLHSLNVSSNNLGEEGLAGLFKYFHGQEKKSNLLRSLHAQGQTPSLEGRSTEELHMKLIDSIGWKIKPNADDITPGCSELPPKVPELINITNLGGHTWEMSKYIDSLCIQTDQPNEKLPYLTLQDVFTICCFLKGHKQNLCVWSEKEWDMITGADRPTTDAPSWLKLPDARDKCIYMCNLPGNTTQQKIEAILEMDADCNLEEACLMKDPVTRNVNGCAWAWMSDDESIQKAVDLYNKGESKIFSQPFSICEVKIKVDNEVSSQLEKTAAADRETRLKERAKEEASHRNLILTSTEAQWKRHAYRLAHPAYADGRIW